jgi:hypothetical protein
MAGHGVELAGYRDVILPVLLACRVEDTSRLWKVQVLGDCVVAIAAFR